MNDALGATARSRPAAIYLGGCACGSVRYAVQLDGALSDARISVWERAVRPRDFRLLGGEEHLSGHQFFEQPIVHYYCERCGLLSFSRFACDTRGPLYLIDLKCLEARAPA